ncbi:MAG TPA: CoA-binding protein, partial [Thermodesulfobacteriota bacterium]
MNRKSTPGKNASVWKALFTPRSVALVGASKDAKKWGFNLLFNIVKGGYPGRIYPINPKESEILGFKAFPSITQVPEPVDTAILVVPSSDMPKVVQECGRNGTKAGVVI